MSIQRTFAERTQSLLGNLKCFTLKAKYISICNYSFHFFDRVQIIYTYKYLQEPTYLPCLYNKKVEFTKYLFYFEHLISGQPCLNRNGHFW